MKPSVAALALVIALALLVGGVRPAAVSAQAPYLPVAPYGTLPPAPTSGAATQATPPSPCPDGPQPMITSYIQGGSVLLPSFLSTGFLTPGAFTAGVGVPFVDGGLLGLDRITEIHNFNGVQGLVLTVFSGGYARPVLGLGVPDYLFRAYGGNLGAIWQDLAAGYLKCRSS